MDDLELQMKSVFRSNLVHLNLTPEEIQKVVEQMYKDLESLFDELSFGEVK